MYHIYIYNRSRKAQRELGDDVPLKTVSTLGQCSVLDHGREHTSFYNKGPGGELRDGVPNALQLMEQDFQMIRSLKSSQQNFVLTNPSLADNPIVYASAGFLQHSGYSAGEIIGRNMRILQVHNLHTYIYTYVYIYIYIYVWPFFTSICCG